MVIATAATVAALTVGQCLDGFCRNPFSRQSSVTITSGRLPSVKFRSDAPPPTTEWVPVPNQVAPPIQAASSVYYTTPNVVSETWTEYTPTMAPSPSPQAPALPSKIMPTAAPAPIPTPTTTTSMPPSPDMSGVVAKEALAAIGDLAKQIADADGRRSKEFAATDTRLSNLERRVGETEAGFQRIGAQVAKFETGAFATKLQSPQGSQWKPAPTPGPETKPTPVPSPTTSNGTFNPPTELESVPLPLPSSSPQP